MPIRDFDNQIVDHVENAVDTVRGTFGCELLGVRAHVASKRYQAFLDLDANFDGIDLWILVEFLHHVLLNFLIRFDG